MKKEESTPVSTSDLLPGSIRQPDSKTVPEVERVRRYPDRRYLRDMSELILKQAADRRKVLDEIEMTTCPKMERALYGIEAAVETLGSIAAAMMEMAEQMPESDDEGGASPGNAEVSHREK